MGDRARILGDLRARIASLEASPEADGDTAHASEGFGSRQRHGTAEEGCLQGERVTRKPRSAFDKLVALVNASDKSEHAIRERLARDGFSEAEVDEAVARGRSYGFVDDRRYGRLLVESRIRQGHGSLGIKRELARNGIDPFIIEGWPDGFDLGYEAELDRALALLERKPPRCKNLREGAYRKAFQKGFPPSVASAAARRWYEEQNR